MNKQELDIIIPVSLESDCGTVESTVSDILEQNRLFGFTRFALSMPSKGWRSISYPPPEFFIEQRLLPQHRFPGKKLTFTVDIFRNPGYVTVQ